MDHKIKERALSILVLTSSSNIIVAALEKLFYSIRKIIAKVSLKTVHLLKTSLL